jgi:DNA-binding MarR family transcriptional regulator
MSILVNGLVDRDLVERGISHSDRRRIQLTLTSKGSHAFDHALYETEARLAEMVAGLTDRQRADIIRSLETLRPIFLPRSLSPVRDDLDSTARSEP